MIELKGDPRLSLAIRQYRHPRNRLSLSFLHGPGKHQPLGIYYCACKMGMTCFPISRF